MTLWFFLGFNLRGKEDSFSTSIMNVGSIVSGDSLGIYYYLGFLQRLRVFEIGGAHKFFLTGSLFGDGLRNPY